MDDTICAISSAAGTGGIGVLRMSGPAAHRVLKAIFRPRKRVRSFVGRRLYLGWVFDPDSNADIDEIYAVFMEPPRTYTREQMAEVYSHGGPAVMKAILALMTGRGARLAEPGEFTRRAFLNGRIDLAQAESVLDIIESESESERACALAQVKGLLSAHINAVRREVLTLLGEVEAEIDFPDEDLDLPPAEGRVARIDAARAGIGRLIASYEEGRVLTQGAQALIVGRTNVGKSSLLNALSERDRAIVTPIPGTTRDLVEDVIHVKGVKFTLIDTAGLRTPGDAIEREGIERVKKRIPEADVILWVLDRSQAYTAEDEEVRLAVQGRKVIAVLNKADLPPAVVGCCGPVAATTALRVEASALTGSGIDGLKEMLYAEAAASFGNRGSQPLVTNARHRNALASAEAALSRGRGFAESHGGIAFLAFELRDAHRYLGEITGETCAPDVLDEIFGKFCIGK